MIVEDSDRLTDQACNALLKAIEEPTARTRWLLCAPTTEDVLPTIRSRCRLVSPTTPTAVEVAAFLVRSSGKEEPAAHAARASQGHIGCGKAGAGPRRGDLAASPRGRLCRPAHLARLLHDGGYLNAVEVSSTRPRCRPPTWTLMKGRPRHGVRGGERPPAARVRPALNALEKWARRRASPRRVLDVVDRALMDLVSVYRDAIAVSVALPATWSTRRSGPTSPRSRGW